MAVKKKDWIKGAVKRKGALTARAKSKGNTVGAEIAQNLRSGTPLQKKQANLGKTLRKMAAAKKKKKSLM